uniref:Uncharacterized protein n=1 Tax=Ombrophytum subterraneum TaxID=50155 RepID=A0A6M8PY03_9MAGN|nr:hypothetical protein [Ombrophytum subterraneum]
MNERILFKVKVPSGREEEPTLACLLSCLRALLCFDLKANRRLIKFNYLYDDSHPLFLQPSMTKGLTHIFILSMKSSDFLLNVLLFVNHPPREIVPPKRRCLKVVGGTSCRNACHLT